MMLQVRLGVAIGCGLLIALFFGPLLLSASPLLSGPRAPAAVDDGVSRLKLAAATDRSKSGHSQEVARLIAATEEKGERELDLTWDGAALGGNDGAKKLEALFNRMYGMNIKVNFTPGPSMPTIAGKLAQEVAAGQRTSTDVFLGSVEHYADLLNKNVLEEYDYSRLSPRIAKDMIPPRPIGVEIYTSTGGITYNSTMVSPGEVPKRLEDVLNPKWKGRIASTAEAAFFNRVAMRPEWGVEKMKAFVTRLSPNIGGLIRVNEVQRVISGEFLMLVLGAGQGVRKEMAKGAPLGFVITEDAAAVHFGLMGSPRNSAHPNLARLFINMVLSEEGQKIVYETHTADHHALPGSRSASDLANLRAQGIEPMRINVKFISEHPEMGKLQTELRAILREKPKS